MASDMTLYWGAGSPPCYRVIITLAEKGVQGYNCKQMSFEKGEHKSPEVMKINPRGQLPAFKHGNVIINESLGICEYLECKYKGQGTALIPQDPADCAMMYQRMHESNSLAIKIADVLYYEWKVPEGERHDTALKRNKETLTAEVKLWEGYLSQGNGQYLAGKNFSLADVAVFPVVGYLCQNGLCPKKYPKLAAYYNNLKERPSIKKICSGDTPCKDALKEI